VQLLRSAPAVGGLQGLRPVTLTDFETLAGLVPAVRSLGAHEREALMTRARVAEAQVGACIVRRGDQSDAAYFILEGRTVAGIPAEDGSYRSLSSMVPGDVFGEIAALTGATRTADVVAETPTTVIELPATTLRTLMSVPAISEMVLSKMSERLARTSVSDLPKFGGLDREGLTSARPADITETAPQPTPAAG
jgi:CRP-like cAMP-binding protein